MFRLLNVTMILILGFCFQAYADDSGYVSNCQKLPAPLAGGFCVNRVPGSKSPDIVYHLHGLNGSETAWQGDLHYGSLIRTEWKNAGIELPTVVTISFGPVWLLAEKNSSPYSGLFELLTQKIIPMIEAQLGGLKGKRLLIGESMGGINSVELALKTTLFDRTAMICAPMVQASPFSSMDDIMKYIQTTGAWAYYTKAGDTTPVMESVKNMVTISTTFFPTPDDWNKADPLQISLLPQTGKKLYVTDGYIDSYASYETTVKFVEQLRLSGADVEWHPMWGPHCVMDIKSLAQFLM